jgi:hypothetical protein
MDDCLRVLVTTEAFALVVEPENAPAVLIATGEQGPAGPPGEDGPAGAPGSGSGVTYMQDFPPPAPLEFETWYNPLTLQLQVYTAAGWQPISPDGGYF